MADPVAVTESEMAQLRAFEDVAQQFSARIRYFLIFIERGEQP